MCEHCCNTCCLRPPSRHATRALHLLPFQLRNTPYGPLCFVCISVTDRHSSVLWRSHATSIGCMLALPKHGWHSHRPATTIQQVGAYNSTDLTTWIAFTYGPAVFTGSQSTSNAMDVIRVWQVSGDIIEMSRSVMEQWCVDTRMGSRIEEVQVSLVSRRGLGRLGGAETQCCELLLPELHLHHQGRQACPSAVLHICLGRCD
jgi:hypothetical protein